MRATRSALIDAVALGFTFDDMTEVVMSLDSGDFYKSMTTHHAVRTWQDVYHYPAVCGDLYVKIQVVDDVVIISFKEL